MPKNKYDDLVLEVTAHDGAQGFEDLLDAMARSASDAHRSDAGNANWRAVARLLRNAKKLVADRTGN